MVNALSKAADGMFWVLQGFMTVQPSMFAKGSAAYQVYQRFLPLANIVLVALFLFIVYSTATGNGFGALSNYDVKKTLPRLLIFAVLLNLSWYICAAAVDLSNIVGANAKEFFTNAISCSSVDGAANETTSMSAKDVCVQIKGAVTDSFWNGNASGGVGLFSNISGGLLAGAAITAGVLLFSFTGIFGTIALAIIVVLLMIVLILIVRQAAVVLLCIIAPLAFAMAMLPNTQSLFKKWWKMFSSMLILYPVIGILFGAASVAGVVLTNLGGQHQQNGIVGVLMQIAGAACPVLFLVFTPMVLKGSLKGLGAVGTAIGGFAAGRMSSAAGRVKSRGKETYEHSALGVSQAQRKSQRTTAQLNRSGSILGNRFGRGMTGVLTGRPSLLGKNTKSSRGVISFAAQQKNKQEEEEIAAETAKFQQDGQDNDLGFLKQTAMADPASARSRAATRLLASKNAADELAEVRQAAESSGAGAAYQRDVSSQYAALKARNPMAVKNMSAGDWNGVTAPQVGAMSQNGKTAALGDAATADRLANAASTNQAFRDNFQEGDWQAIAAQGGATGAAAQKILDAYHNPIQAPAAAPVQSAATPTPGTPTTPSPSPGATGSSGSGGGGSGTTSSSSSGSSNTGSPQAQPGPANTPANGAGSAAGASAGAPGAASPDVNAAVDEALRRFTEGVGQAGANFATTIGSAGINIEHSADKAGESFRHSGEETGKKLSEAGRRTAEHISEASPSGENSTIIMPTEDEIRKYGGGR